MIKIVNDINEYLDWIDSLCFDTRFSTPFCDKARVTAVSNKENHRLLCAYDGDRLIGIFCLLVLEEEEYIETVFLYTKEKKAYEDLMDYLSKQYKGYEIWFVYNPKNDVLGNYLSEKQAFFYTEQRYMEYKGVKKADVSEVIPYCDSYKNEYISIHNKEGYWDGEKVLANIEDFYIYLYIQNQHLVGYIDLSKENDTNEIMDWIKECQKDVLSKLNKKIERVFKKEPKEVNRKEYVDHMDIHQPFVCVGYKMDACKTKAEAFEKDFAVNMWLDSIMGPLNPKFQEWLDQRIFTQFVGAEADFTLDHSYILFYGTIIFRIN